MGDGAVTVNGRNVVAADNEATNGVSHIIDGVLLPPAPTLAPTPAPKNLVELAQSVDILSTLVAAVVAGDLVETLSSAGPFTVFAPTNDAFAALPAGTLDSLLQPENKGTLVDILTYHVVSGKVLSTDLAPSQEVATVQGNTLLIKARGSAVTLVETLSSPGPFTVFAPTNDAFA